VSAGFLVVRASGERYGVELASIEEVVDLAAPATVPSRLPALRGVARWRGRHLSVLHLGASVGASPTAGASGVWAVEGALVTMLDLEALAGRLAEQGEAG
jgi:chemotaxis signal transduction protein